MMKRHLLLQQALLSLCLTFFLTPFFAYAAPLCCLCAKPSTEPVCLTGEFTSCETLYIESSNANVKQLACKGLSAEECRTKTPDEPSGVCTSPPTGEASYGTTPGTDTTDNASAAAALNIKPLITPNQSIQIPGLTYSSTPLVRRGFLEIPFLAQFVSAFYRYLVGISIIAAAIMIVYGGTLYITSSTVTKINSGKDIIRDAIVGLVLVLTTFTILQTVNLTLTVPQPIALKAILPIEYQDMYTQFGFRDTGAPFPGGLQPGEGSGGTAPRMTIAPTDPVTVPGGAPGEIPNGLPYQRLQQYCTKAEDAANLKTYDEKILYLVRAVLGWKIVCMDQKGCTYVRTGVTNLKNGDIYAGEADTPFYLNSVAANIGITPWSQFCDAIYKVSGGNIWFRSGYKPPSLHDPAISEYTWGKLKTGAPAIGGCYRQVREIYTSQFVEKIEVAGIVGGDCGTTLAQIYKCAGGKIGRGNNFEKIIAYASAPKDHPDVIVHEAKTLEDFVAQLYESGGPKFGDIVVMGNLSNNHNIMYTGGREDVPFDVFEMGGGPSKDGAVGTQISCRTLGLNCNYIGGMRAHPRGSFESYVNEYAFAGKSRANARPVTVIRPYEYTSCESRSECGEAQACKCTSRDGGRDWLSNKCGFANTCHKVKFGNFCRNDEHCGNGSTCVKGSCTKTN